MDTWISHLHLHGILMAIYLPLGTRTRLAASGMLGTCPSLLLCSRATWEQLDQSVSHLTGDSWPWQNQLISCMSMMRRTVMKWSRRSIFLVRSLVCLSVQTQNPFSLEYGIAPMVASFSTIVAGIIRISTPCCETIPVLPRLSFNKS